MVCEREFETAVAWVRLQLGFAQRRLTVAALHGDQYLESMAGSSGRLQLRGFARSCICLIEFSLGRKERGPDCFAADRKVDPVLLLVGPVAPPHRAYPNRR